MGNVRVSESRDRLAETLEANVLLAMDQQFQRAPVDPKYYEHRNAIQVSDTLIRIEESDESLFIVNYPRESRSRKLVGKDKAQSHFTITLKDGQGNGTLVFVLNQQEAIMEKVLTRSDGFKYKSRKKRIIFIAIMLGLLSIFFFAIIPILAVLSLPAWIVVCIVLSIVVRPTQKWRKKISQRLLHDIGKAYA